MRRLRHYTCKIVLEVPETGARRKGNGKLQIIRFKKGKLDCRLVLMYSLVNQP